MTSKGTRANSMLRSAPARERGYIGELQLSRRPRHDLDHALSSGAPAGPWPGSSAGGILCAIIVSAVATVARRYRGLYVVASLVARDCDLRVGNERSTMENRVLTMQTRLLFPLLI